MFTILFNNNVTIYLREKSHDYGRGLVRWPVGYEDSENRPLALGRLAAADFHPAFMFPDDPQRDPNSQAGAGDAFGREEGFEDAGQQKE